MAITLAEKQSGQGKRLRVPAGELPINTQAFFFFFPDTMAAQECEETETQGETHKKKGGCIMFSKVTRMEMTLFRHKNESRR